MDKVEVIIGRFRRPAFAEGLAARMAARDGLSVSLGAAMDLPALIGAARGPLVLIFDAAERAGFDVDFDSLPDGASLTVISIADEGREVRVRMNDVGAARLGDITAAAGRSAFRLAAPARIGRLGRHLRAALAHRLMSVCAGPGARVARVGAPAPGGAA